MIISTSKTKTMVIANCHKTHSIKLGGKSIEQVKSYKYLGAVLSEDGRMEAELDERLGKAGIIFNAMKNRLLEKKEVPQAVKIEVIKRIVRPTILYGSETWTLSDRLKSRVNAMETRFLRRSEGKMKKDKIKNKVF